MSRAHIFVASVLLTFWCSSANSAIVTQGDLVLDSATNIIIDSLNSVEYLQFDVLSGTIYDDVVSVLGVVEGGGWSIATASEANDFANAMFSGALSCDAFGNCGTLVDWYDGKFGGTPDPGFDAFWFLNTGGGFSDVEIDSGGDLHIQNSNRSIAETDNYISVYGDTYLLVRPTAVPVPASAVLFVSGLVWLFGAVAVKNPKLANRTT